MRRTAPAASRTLRLRYTELWGSASPSADDLGRGERATASVEDADDGAPVGRVALALGAQAPLDLEVELRRGGGGRGRRRHGSSTLLERGRSRTGETRCRTGLREPPQDFPTRPPTRNMTATHPAPHPPPPTRARRGGGVRRPPLLHLETTRHETMHIDPCCGGPVHDEPAADEPRPPLSRRRVLLGAGVGAGALVLRAVPAGAETASSDDTTPSPSSTSSSTTNHHRGPPHHGTGHHHDHHPAAARPGLDGGDRRRPPGQGLRLPAAPARLGGPRPPDDVPDRGPGAAGATPTSPPEAAAVATRARTSWPARCRSCWPASDGVVIELRYGSGGNSLYLKGDDGWYYCYLHINNDTPGTDDGANRYDQAFGPGIGQGVPGQEGPAHRLRGRQRQRRGLRLALPLRDPDAQRQVVQRRRGQRQVLPRRGRARPARGRRSRPRPSSRGATPTR